MSKIPSENHLTYVGRRLDGRKLQHTFIDEARGDGTTVYFPKAKASAFAGCRIGRTYKFGRQLPEIWGSAEVGEVDEQKRLDWQARDRANHQASIEKAGSASPELDAAVDAIRSARNRMGASHRAGFDAWLLNKIR